MNILVFVLNIIDDDTYRDYRRAIHPLMDQLGIVVLHEYGIDEVINSNEEKDQVNRLAVFGFPNEDAKKTFFNNPVYLDAKKLFEASTENFLKIVE